MHPLDHGALRLERELRRATGHGKRDAPGLRELAGVEPHEARRRRGRAERSEQAGRVEAGFARRIRAGRHAEPRHDFVAGENCRHDVPPGRPPLGADRERRGDHDRARVAVRGFMGVVELIAMRRGAVDETGRRRACPVAAADQNRPSRRAVLARPGRQLAAPGLERSAERDRGVVEDQALELVDVFGRELLRRQRNEVFGQRNGGDGVPCHGVHPYEYCCPVSVDYSKIQIRTHKTGNPR